jgi:hypothetical protein
MTVPGHILLKLRGRSVGTWQELLGFYAGETGDSAKSPNTELWKSGSKSVEKSLKR